MYHSSSILYYTGLFILFFAICAIIVLFLRAVRNSVARINTLTHKFSEIQEGNFTTIEYKGPDDEIGIMIKAFNIMTEKIDELINQNYLVNLNLKELAIKNREAQLHALQSQMHPHFLFNVLESIRMKMINQNIADADRMLVELSILLRKSFEFSAEMVTIRDELEFIRVYVNIQKLRFRDRIQYEVNAADKLQELQIPRLILQPLVENAILHGLEPKVLGGQIKIAITQEGPLINLKVSDTGIGIDSYKLDAIRESIYNPGEQTGENMALRNIHERIRMIFGKEYGLEIISRRGAGTDIILLIPADTDY